MESMSTAARAVRIELIRQGAITRQALGQAALHRLLRDGTHEIVLHGERFIGTTLAEAIDRARAGRESA